MSNEKEDRGCLYVGLVLFIVFWALMGLLCSCNSTHKVSSDSKESVKKDSVTTDNESYGMGMDSSVKDNSYHAHFATGDSTLDNDLTIVFDSAANHFVDSSETPVTIEQNQGSITISAGKRKIRSIQAKTHAAGSITTTKADSVIHIETVKSFDTGSTKKADSIHATITSTAKHEDKKALRVPAWVYIVGALVLAGAGLYIYHRWQANKVTGVLKSILPTETTKQS